MAFESTLWHLVRRAREADPAALNEFVARYREPVRRFIEFAGIPSTDAEDLTQEVFLRIFQDRVLEKADRELGRFRSLILAVTRHVIGSHRQHDSAAKRGGGRVPVSLDEAGEALVDDRDEDVFDREWMSNLLRLALARLERESAVQHAALVASVHDGKCYREIATTLGRTEVDIWNDVRAAKKKLARFVRDEMADYAMSEDECRIEAEQLGRFLEE